MPNLFASPFADLLNVLVCSRCFPSLLALTAARILHLIAQAAFSMGAASFFKSASPQEVIEHHCYHRNVD